MNAEQKEKEEAAWKAAHEASIAAANAQRAFYEAITKAREEDLATFMAGRVKPTDQTQLVPASSAPNLPIDAPQESAPNSSNANPAHFQAPRAAADLNSSSQTPFYPDSDPMENNYYEHERSPSPFFKPTTATRGVGGRPKMAHKQK